MTRQKLVLVDGHSLAYRAFHALPTTLQTSTGELTNASYGFTSMLFTVLESESPDYIIVTFDKGPSFRVQMYAEYKAHREKMPDEMRGQMERIREIVMALGIPIVILEDYEADDVLGTLSRQAAETGLDVLIVTGDRDALQLVDDTVTVLTSGRRFSDTIYYTPAKVRERYGLEPSQLIDLKALMGDTSDNIPGVKGVGEKGGIQLLQQYGTLDEVYAHLEEHSARYRNALSQGREDAYLSQKLGRIVRDAPVVLDLSSAAVKRGVDLRRIIQILQALESQSLLDRLPNIGLAESPAPATGQLSLFAASDTELSEPSAAEAAGHPEMPQYHLVADMQALIALIARLKLARAIAVDTETTGIDPMMADLVGIALTDCAGTAWYLPLRAPEEEPVLDLAAVVQHLGPVLQDANIVKYGHNLKYDLKMLHRYGLPVAGTLFDTMVAAWVIDPASHDLGLKSLAWMRLGVQMTEISDLIGRGRDQKTMDQVPLAQVVPYAAADADMTFRLAQQFAATLDAQQMILFRDMEMPLLPILLEMEMYGVRLDIDWLHTLSQELDKRLAQLGQEIYDYAGAEFNVNSTQQLSDVLFQQLGLPAKGISRTKSGHYSTRADVLERLRGKHPIVDCILAQRELAKLKSTYVDALPQLVNPKTGRVHTSYHQTGAVTGRLSSVNPNLQNIPIRSEEGRRVRRAFVAEDGWVLVGADYSQVELRVMAHVSEDEGLMGAFARNEDIHATTAAAVYEVSLDQVNYDMRRIAKAVNFGLIYGQSAYGLARQLGIEVSEADAFIKRYFERFPKVQVYMDTIQREVEVQGYVETLLHRRRYFPELGPGSTASTSQRQAAQRMAINAPIQGSAADILKLAMIRMHRMLKDNGLRARMLLQVHDEVVLEVPREELDQTISLVREAMERAYTLNVPLKVDIEVGHNWEEMK
ncbi:MAG: DNA polymerase I [Anaerolineae bacterium]|nr:DNA polymerase I [Anaerolineae bacterium]